MRPRRSNSGRLHKRRGRGLSFCFWAVGRILRRARGLAHPLSYGFFFHDRFHRCCAIGPSGRARRSSIQFLLRLEGLGVAAVTALLYSRNGASWWLFRLRSGLCPISRFLVILPAQCRGARVYNAMHSYVGPVGAGGLRLCAARKRSGASNRAHMGQSHWSRSIAGLRTEVRAMGSGFTHLGRVGKESR